MVGKRDKMSEDGKGTPSAEQAKAALRKAERDYERVKGYWGTPYGADHVVVDHRASNAALAALQAARDDYFLALARKKPRKKRRRETEQEE